MPYEVCAPYPISVNDIGEHVRHQSCERRFQLGYRPFRHSDRLPFVGRIFNVLDPVLQEVGRKYEDTWERSLKENGKFKEIIIEKTEKNRGIEWADFVTELLTIRPGVNVYAREVNIAGDIGTFNVSGRMDFLLVVWRNGTPFLRIVECKASRRDRTYHRVQLAIYRMLTLQSMHEYPLNIGGIELSASSVECVVARIDEDTNTAQNILDIPPVHDVLIESDVSSLLAKGGQLESILLSDLSDLPYRLDSKCDGCIFNVDCLPESGRLGKLELLGIDPTTVRALRNHGVLDLRDLATLDLESSTATAIRQGGELSEPLDILKAKSSARISTLPKTKGDPDTYSVQALPNRWASQLPLHEKNGRRLVRVYLCVDYDYTENRIGALSAHVTMSKGLINTAFRPDELGKWRPDPNIHEVSNVKPGSDDTQTGISGQSIVGFKRQPWSGNYSLDTGAERELIQNFLSELVEAIATESQNSHAPIHIYVWTSREIRHLVEACARCGSDLLASIRELLGCRESLEQLIFSCLSDEILNRYALGWSGHGLVVATSVRWFGKVFHWQRIVNNTLVNLDQVFEQDLFDFKSTLKLTEHGEWASDNDVQADSHRFEIRSRNFDSLPAPYWHAFWSRLPDPSKVTDSRVKNAIERYNRAQGPGLLKAYLRERTHALRWLEERIQFKNDEIEKPPLEIARLQQFELGVDSCVKAALDFLRLEQHMRYTQWLARHLVEPRFRVTSGKSLPLRNIQVLANNLLKAEIDPEGYEVSLSDLEARTTITEGGFVRFATISRPDKPLTIKQLQKAGSTCIVESIDWERGTINLSMLPLRAPDTYLQSSYLHQFGSQPIPFGILDESVSDFVSRRVDRRLQSESDSPIYRWLDATSPVVPPILSANECNTLSLEKALTELRINGSKLMPDQQRSILDSIDVRVHLLQGPPGTGKTHATAVGLLAKLAIHNSVGQIMLISGNTHLAVDNLLNRLATVIEPVRSELHKHGIPLPDIHIVKVHSSSVSEGEQLPSSIENLTAESKAGTRILRLLQSKLVIIGGTTSAILNLSEKLSNRKDFQSRGGVLAHALAVDEASMMVFPHFLALSSLCHMNAWVSLAGDHRQLSPILVHDWPNEDRPPVELYQPFVSAYDAIQKISDKFSDKPNTVKRSALEFTFRLPSAVRMLISRIYEKDNISLKGNHRPPSPLQNGTQSLWEEVWAENGIFLIGRRVRYITACLLDANFFTRLPSAQDGNIVSVCRA